ncbi:hypothetical protein MUG91_G9n25 [Manis pentadactyla]|nr:hypothetical protein MUG91_G9n25 [Manis pentadactyla]
MLSSFLSEHHSGASEWHPDRDLSAFGSWRCPLPGLLLGTCAPGGCESGALAAGLRNSGLGSSFQLGVRALCRSWHGWASRSRLSASRVLPMLA